MLYGVITITKKLHKQTWKNTERVYKKDRRNGGKEQSPKAEMSKPVKKLYISHSLAILFLDIIPTLVTLSPIKHQPDHNVNKNTQCHNYPSKNIQQIIFTC